MFEISGIVFCSLCISILINGFILYRKRKSNFLDVNDERKSLIINNITYDEDIINEYQVNFKKYDNFAKQHDIGK